MNVKSMLRTLLNVVLTLRTLLDNGRLGILRRVLNVKTTLRTLPRRADRGEKGPYRENSVEDPT